MLRRGTSKRALGQRSRRQRERATCLRLDQGPIHPFPRAEDDHIPTPNTRPHSPSVEHDDTDSDFVPLARRPYIEPINTLTFGQMNITCNLCAALHWMDERIKASSKSSPRFSHCCHHGKVRLDPLLDPPGELQQLFTAQLTQAKEFRENIRQYNSALAFTSFTVKEKHNNSEGGGPWVWKSGYTIYHRAGTLFPDANNNPKYT